MSEQTVVAESSPAPVVPQIEVDRGPLVTWTPEQRSEFRRTGKPPEPPKVEESAPSDPPKEATSEAEPKAESAGETEPPKSQPQEHGDKGSRRAPGAEKRIGELTSENKRLKAELEALKSKPAQTAAPEPKPEQPQNYQEWRKSFKPVAWVEQYAKDNPQASYEEATAAMADYLADVRDQFRSREQTAREQAQQLNSKLAEARSRYQNFDEVMQPALTAIVGDQAVSNSVKEMLNDSEVLPDLLFTIGSDQNELDSFLKMAKEQPGKALRYIALTESLIRDEISSKVRQPEAEKPVPPAKPQTNAPPPPAEVGGRAATPGDALEAAAKANDFRAFKAEANRRALARLKG